MGRVPEPAQLLNQEEAAVELESSVTENCGMHAGRVQQQLRLDAVKVGGVEQGLKEMLQQGLFDFKRRGRSGAKC